MKHKLILLFIISFSLSGFGQDKKADLIGIKTAINNYYDGYIYRDINKLNQAFDTINGAMKVPVKENGKVVGFRNRWFKELLPKWGNRKQMSSKTLSNCELGILHIDLVDAQIASAKISMQVDSVTYIDILSLHKIQNAWKITNKMFTVRKTESKKLYKNFDARAKVALKFMNDYVVNCNKFKESMDIQSWTNKNNMASEVLKKRLAQMIAEGEKKDPEIGLGFDPFLNAQEWPSEGFEIEKQYGEYIVLRGKKWKDFKVKVQVINENNKMFVNGAGVVFSSK